MSTTASRITLCVVPSPPPGAHSLLLFLFVSLLLLLKAGRLTVGAQKRVGHKDKRNLYLADEGLVLEDSAAAEGAAKSDMEKRVLARKDKKSKLKNPIFFVSPTRLSVRNLGRHVTDAKLKSMAMGAARAGVQAGRATPQDVRLYLEAQARPPRLFCVRNLAPSCGQACVAATRGLDLMGVVAAKEAEMSTVTSRNVDDPNQRETKFWKFWNIKSHEAACTAVNAKRKLVHGSSKWEQFA